MFRTDTYKVTNEPDPMPDDRDKKLEMEIGMKVEQEHHKGEKETREIVKDHLRENPHYYTMMTLAGVFSGDKDKR